MSYGLLVFDGTGEKLLDTSDRLFRYVGEFQTGTIQPGSCKTIKIAGMENNGKWFFDYRGTRHVSTSIRIITGGILVCNNGGSTVTQPNLVFEVFRS